MARTRKIQVTLDERQYQDLAEIARRDKRKLASVVRETIEKYALEPELERIKRKALEELFEVDPVPVPERYADWKQEYGGRKNKRTSKKS
jgi:hypothetical protein